MDLFKRFFGGGPVQDINWEQLFSIANVTWQELDGVLVFGKPIADDIIVFRTIMPKGSKLDLHKHTGALEKVIITGGKIRVNNMRNYEQGGEIKFPDGYAHEVVALEDTDLLVVFYKR